MNFAHCLRIVFVIGKYTDVFRGILLVGGWGDWATWEDLSMDEFLIGKDNFFEGCSGYPNILIKKIRNYILKIAFFN